MIFRRQILILVVVCFLFPDSSHASGVAARRRQMQRPSAEAQRQIQEKIRQQRELQLRLQIQQQREIQLRMQQQSLPAPPAQKDVPPPVQYRQPNILTSSPGLSPSSGVTDPAIEQKLAPLIRQFDQSSEFWPRLEDGRVKAILLSYYIDLYRQFGIMIRKSPADYATIINGMAQQRSALLKYPLDQVLRMVAIIEYDYDDGTNKDALALEILGSREAVAQNKARLGIR